MLIKESRFLINKYFKSNRYYQNILELSSGSLISNALIILSTPVLARIYTPSDFGLYSVFMSVLTTIAIFSTGRYEFAIALPKSRMSAISILHSIIIISIIFSILIILIVSIVFYFKLISIPNFDYQLIFLFILSVFFLAVNSGLIYFSYREHRYRLVSLNSILQAVVILASNFYYFFINLKYGLILGFMTGQCFSILFFARTIKIDYFRYDFQLMKKTLIKYVDFPKYNLFSDFLLNLSQQFLPVILSIFYGQTIVGAFTMANRLLRLPSIVVISSVSNVFRNEVIETLRLNQKSSYLYKYTLKRLIFLSAPIFLLILISVKFLINHFLGSDWILAGEIARILSVMIFFDFISMPFNCIYQIYNKQNISMKIQIISTTLSVLSIFIGHKYYGSIFMSIFLYSISNVIISLLNILFTYNISKTFIRE